MTIIFGFNPSFTLLMLNKKENMKRAIGARLSQNLSRILIGRRMTKLASSPDKSGQAM